MEQQGWGHWIRCEEEELIKKLLSEVHQRNISLHDDLRELKEEYWQLGQEVFKERQETRRLRLLLESHKISHLP